MREEPTVQRWREYALVSLAFAATRLVILSLGLQFNFSLDWMWLSDPADLQNRLAQTIYYFHAFPPGMDLFTGILLKVAGTHAALLAQITFWLLGLVLITSIFYLERACGLSARVSFLVAIAFSLLPQSVYFEHLYLYEEPIAALLCLSVALFHAALTRQSVRLWLGFFTVCAVIGVTRSTFHLLWFAVMLCLGLWFSTPRDRRRVLAAASAPAALVIALYVKNLIVFGTFSAFTYGPSSYAHVTVSHLTPETKAQWVHDRRLSPFAALSPYAGPREYLRVYSGTPPTNWPSQLTDLDRPTVHAPNFNHWVILEANRGRNGDAWYYMRTQPLEYAATALHGLEDFFTASTEWHPYTGTERSPHYQHRQVLGRYESIVNRLVHGFPVAPVGLYAFLPLVMIWTALRAWRLLRSSNATAKAEGALLGLCLLNIAYVVGISSAFTFFEESRYRYQVESLIWVTTALCVAHVCWLTMKKSDKRLNTTAL